MQLTLHATRRTHYGASRLVVDCEPGPAKTRRAPSRLCRDARSMVIFDYGMQDIEYTPPLRLARDAWSMVIRLRQAIIEYAPLAPSRKGRVVNGHTTKASNN